MGERVTQSGRQDLARAQRLKSALASGRAPAFTQAKAAAAGGEGACSENSCPVAPLPEAVQKNQDSRSRLQFLEQMFAASPDALAVADCRHVVLLANEKFVDMFGYHSAEVVGQ